MNPSETLTNSASYTGHVKDGVVVLDGGASLAEGQTVRVEPVAGATAVDAGRAERLNRMRQAFAEWTEEDARLPDEEADRLSDALAREPRARFRAASID